MKFFHFSSNKSPQEIKGYLYPFGESEKHSPWLILEKFTNDRAGAHLYIQDNTVTGYYESGEHNIRGSLSSAKSWIYFRIFEKNGMTHVKGVSVFSPIVTLIIELSLIVTLIELLLSTNDSWIGFFLVMFCRFSVWDRSDNDKKQLVGMIQSFMQK